MFVGHEGFQPYSFHDPRAGYPYSPEAFVNPQLKEITLMLGTPILTPHAYLSHSFRVRRLLAAIAFFIFLSGAGQAQTYFGGTPQTIDNGINNAVVGPHTSQKVVNGFPAVSYYDATNGDLMYIRANHPSGASWEMEVKVDTGGPANDNVGQFTSLEVVNGIPAISYYDVTNTNLKYVRANDEFGISWGEPITIDSVGDAGQYTSLEVVNGCPAISYHYTRGPRLGTSLRYVRANDAFCNGASWGTARRVESSDSGPTYNSLAVISGNPAISYYYASSGGGGRLRYIRATDDIGTNWDPSVVVDSSSITGSYNSLAMVNGRPAISYYRSSCACLRYVRALNDTGATRADWGAPVTIDDTSANVGQYNSLAIVNGKPAISYYDFTNRNLKYVRAKTAEGATLADWGTPLVIDGIVPSGTPPLNVGGFTSLAVVNCSPAISYFASTNGNLKYYRSIPVWSGAGLPGPDHWDVDGNWGHGCVPEPGDSVLLPRTGVIREAIIDEGDVIVTDLTMETNRTLRISGGGTLKINGVLTMGGRNITVDPGSTIIFGCNASVMGESATDFIIGDVRKEFCSTGSFRFPVGEITGAAEFSPMTATVTAGTFPPDDPPSLTVSVTDTWLPALVQSSAVSRYWTVTEDGDLTADMTFMYLDPTDVNGSENNYKVFRHAGGFTTEITPNSQDSDANTATVENVSSFSDWGIGALTPTAASINIGGRITDQNGTGVPGALVTMAGQNSTVFIARTNPFGYYRFENVGAGQIYIVSVASKRHRFPVQVVNAGEDITDLDFIAQ